MYLFSKGSFPKVSFSTVHFPTHIHLPLYLLFWSSQEMWWHLGLAVIYPFTSFPTFDMDQLEKIHQHRWKEHFKIGNLARLKVICWKSMKMYNRCLLILLWHSAPQFKVGVFAWWRILLRLLSLRQLRQSYGNYQSPQSSRSSRIFLKWLRRSWQSEWSYGNQA